MKRLMVLALICLTGMAFAQIPVPAGFPNGNTTGPKGAGLAYSDLKASGGFTANTAGQVIQGLDITGSITVKASNVTIRNCRIRFSSAYGIKNEGSGTRIEYCEIAGTQNYTSACVSGSNMTLSRCNIYGAADGIKTGSNTIVEYSWVHDLRKWTGTHNDCLQNSGGGRHIIIRHNTLQAPYKNSNAVSQNATNFGPIDDMLFESNFMSGGAYCIQMRNKETGYGDPTNIRFVKNVFEKNSTMYGLFTTDGNGITYSCNRYHTGELISQNRTCNDAGTVAGPVFSPNGGNFNGTRQVTITCATDGATVYYTVNGQVPTASSTKYTGAVTVSTTTTIRAMAIKSGLDDSPVTSATFRNIDGMVIIEAENMTLGTGYIPDTDSRLAGQTIMVDPALGIPGTGTAVTAFTGPDGMYDLVLNGVPENDGEPTVKVYVNSTLVLTARYPIDVKNHTLDKRLDFNAGGIAVKNGDVIKLEGTSNKVTGGSFARVDKITFIQTNASVNDWQLTIDDNTGLVVGPNPMRETISFSLALTDEKGDIDVIISDREGRVVSCLQNAPQSSSVSWNGQGAAPGMYFYTVTTGDRVMSGKIMKAE